jgi:hypothetical protein
VGSAGQGRAVDGQSDLAKNWAVFGQVFGYFLGVISTLMKLILFINQNQRFKRNGGTFPQVK